MMLRLLIILFVISGLISYIDCNGMTLVCRKETSELSGLLKLFCIPSAAEKTGANPYGNIRSYHTVDGFVVNKLWSPELCLLFGNNNLLLVNVI